MFGKIAVLKFFIKISEALETKILEQIFEYQKTNNEQFLRKMPN